MLNNEVTQRVALQCDQWWIQVGNPAMAPIQSDSLAINFESDIIRKKCIHCGQLILRKISKIGDMPDVRFQGKNAPNSISAGSRL